MITLEVVDLERSALFYENGLGFPRAGGHGQQDAKAC